MDSMAYGIVTRISKMVVTALVVASIGLALLSTGAVHAQDNEQEPGSLPCSPFGQDGPPTIPEETIIKVGDSYYQCLRGFWWKLPSKATSAAGATTLSPGTTTSGGGKHIFDGPARVDTVREVQ